MRLQLLLLVALFLVGCCSLPGGGDILGQVPSNAKTVAILRLNTFLVDADLSQFYSVISGGANLNTQVTQLLEGTSLDSRSISQAVLFILEDGNNTSSAFIFQNPDGLTNAESALRSNSSWLATNYSGRTIFQAPDGRCILLTDGNAVVGDAAAVKAVIEVKTGIRPSLRQNAKLIRMIGELSADSSILVASEITSSARSNLALLNGPLNPSALSTLDSAGFQATKTGTNITLKLILRTNSTEDADELKNATINSIGVISTMATDSSAFNSLLGRISIHSSGDAVYLNLTTTSDELRAAKAEMSKLGE